jgi:hypothetical protein
MVHIAATNPALRSKSLADGSLSTIIICTGDIPIWVPLHIHAHDRRMWYALRPSRQSAGDGHGSYLFGYHAEDDGKHLDPS